MSEDEGFDPTRVWGGWREQLEVGQLVVGATNAGPFRGVIVKLTDDPIWNIHVRTDDGTVVRTLCWEVETTLPTGTDAESIETWLEAGG